MRSTKAVDNMGMAYEHAQKFCPPGIPVEDSDVFADACLGLVQAERSYDPNRGAVFSTLAWWCIRNVCVDGFRIQHKFDRLESFGVEEESQFGTLKEKDNYDYLSCFIVSLLKGLKPKLSTRLQFDLELLLMHYLNKWSLTHVGDRYGISGERVRQRISRIKKYLAKILDYETLEEMADVGSYRDGLQRWWQNDFNDEVFSRSSAA